jgi:peptidoglycan/LPS O-acetylase OafA/YrhL
MRSSRRKPDWTKTLGNASYSIDLMHMPVGTAMLMWTGGWSHRMWNHVGWSMLMHAACVGSGQLSYRLAEKPLMDLVKKQTNHENMNERKHEKKSRIGFVVSYFRGFVFSRR